MGSLDGLGSRRFPANAGLQRATGNSGWVLVGRDQGIIVCLESVMYYVV